VSHNTRVFGVRIVHFIMSQTPGTPDSKLSRPRDSKQIEKSTKISFSSDEFMSATKEAMRFSMFQQDMYRKWDAKSTPTHFLLDVARSHVEFMLHLGMIDPPLAIAAQRKFHVHELAWDTVKDTLAFEIEDPNDVVLPERPESPTFGLDINGNDLFPTGGLLSNIADVTKFDSSFTRTTGSYLVSLSSYLAMDVYKHKKAAFALAGIVAVVLGCSVSDVVSVARTIAPVVGVPVPKPLAKAIDQVRVAEAVHENNFQPTEWALKAYSYMKGIEPLQLTAVEISEAARSFTSQITTGAPLDPYDAQSTFVTMITTGATTPFLYAAGLGAATVLFWRVYKHHNEKWWPTRCRQFVELAHPALEAWARPGGDGQVTLEWADTLYPLPGGGARENSLSSMKNTLDRVRATKDRCDKYNLLYPVMGELKNLTRDLEGAGWTDELLDAVILYRTRRNEVDGILSNFATKSNSNPTINELKKSIDEVYKLVHDRVYTESLLRRGIDEVMFVNTHADFLEDLIEILAPRNDPVNKYTTWYGDTGGPRIQGVKQRVINLRRRIRRSPTNPPPPANPPAPAPANPPAPAPANPPTPANNPRPRGRGLRELRNLEDANPTPRPRRGVGSSVDAIVDAFLESRPFDG